MNGDMDRPKAGLIVFGAVVVGVLAVSVWAGHLRTNVSGWRRIRREGVIRIGYSIERPYAYPDETGRITGEAAELARVIVERLGVARIEWRQTEFGALIDGLQGDRFDVAAASMFITAGRAEQVAFSEPTLRMTQGLLVRAGNPLILHAYEDLARPGVRVAVVEGAVEGPLLVRLGVPERQVVAVPDAISGWAAVAAGRADALALTAFAIAEVGQAAPFQAVEPADPFRQPVHEGAAGHGYGAFVFRKEDAALRRAWNRELAAFIGTTGHVAILERFGLDRANLPGATRASDITGAP